MQLGLKTETSNAPPRHAAQPRGAKRGKKPQGKTEKKTRHNQTKEKEQQTKGTGVSEGRKNAGTTKETRGRDNFTSAAKENKRKTPNRTQNVGLNWPNTQAHRETSEVHSP